MRFKILFIAGALALSSAFPLSAAAQSVSVEDSYRVTLLQLIAVLQQQILQLQAQLEQQTESSASVDWSGSESRFLPESAQIVAEYVVTNADTSRVGNQSHQAYIERIFTLFPDAYDAKLTQFAVFSDEAGMFDAYVETLPSKHETWLFSVNEDAVKEVGTESSDELIFHELAHIISYEAIVGVPTPAVQSCHSYFKQSGCLAENMYLYVFTDAFWTTADLNRALDYSNDRDPVESAYRYFQSNEEEYVSDYAALSPEEDFAESFAVYVTDPVTRDGSVKSRKVWWFDQFAEFRGIKAGY